MKVEISYTVTKTEVITVPKEWEFYFKKDEGDYTDEEWNILDNRQFLDLPYDDVDVESEVE